MRPQKNIEASLESRKRGMPEHYLESSQTSDNQIKPGIHLLRFIDKRIKTNNRQQTTNFNTIEKT